MRLASIGLAGGVDPWVVLGFEPDMDGRLRLGNGALELGREPARLAVEPATCGVEPPESIDGIAVSCGAALDGTAHPNGALELDHVVVMTDSITRTSHAIEIGLGLELRRVRETPDVRQAFHRFADHGSTRGCIIELVEHSSAASPSIWGVVVIVADLDAAVAGAPELIGRPKPAVQPGRRIATVGRAAGLGTGVAFMDR